ncbi:uncharacterized protein N7500_010659 [Penicillium coprophilum]|uniref:uncharacterized protein n=1 Tax=Penicillium coprophilum TaxID=36646 RepID=UPI0023A5FD90|nr:uncharacterized protein N7500_010659 [Penicillium coprophilum]KAJ5150470.1 hypothetical protein N7500_010659 [Penicillium coprophilum]
MDSSKEPKPYKDQQRIPQKNRRTLHSASLTNVDSSGNPDDTCKRYTQLLHEYNDIKDVGQGLMGLLAEARGMRQVEVEKEFGVSEED